MTATECESCGEGRTAVTERNDSKSKASYSPLSHWPNSLQKHNAQPSPPPRLSHVLFTVHGTGSSWVYFYFNNGLIEPPISRDVSWKLQVLESSTSKLYNNIYSLNCWFRQSKVVIALFLIASAFCPHRGFQSFDLFDFLSLRAASCNLCPPLMGPKLDCLSCLLTGRPHLLAHVPYQQV